jgi:hypothetical protein
LCFVSLVQGNALNVQGVWHALRSGDPRYTVMALTALSALESVKGSKFMKRAQHLIAEAEVLADRLGDPWTKGRTQLADGIRLKANGKWKDGAERLETAMATFAACQGVRWEIETAQTLRHDALYWMGDWEQLARELPVRLAEAEQRGDRYAINNVAIRFNPILQMGLDDLEQARKEFVKGERLLPDGAFQLPHRLAVSTGIDLDLYGRDPVAADERFKEAWPRLAPMCRVWQNGRIEMVFYRTRIALALARQATSDVQKRAALLRAERDCRDLENDAPWSKVLAQLARATLSHAHGRTDAAIAELDAAAYALRECHMHHYAAAADYRRGMLLGESGRGLVAEASAWMRLHHMLNPSRMADLLAPGPWTN